MEKRETSFTVFRINVLILVVLFSSLFFPAGTSFAFPGDIHTYAGNGTAGFSYDGGQATGSELSAPFGVAAGPDGSMYIADRVNDRIRKVDGSGIITTVAGNGSAAYFGDGGPATSASLNNPMAVAFDAQGNMYIADRGNNRIRMVDTSGVITTVAGNGKAGFSGDGRSAVLASIKYPEGVVVDSFGNVYISDSGNNRVRKVGLDGIIYTVAGTGRAGYSGDGGPATSAKLYHPESLWLDGSGNLYIADCNNNRVRRVDITGTITTVAGTGTRGYSGDGGPAASANLNYPFGITGDTSGNLYISGGDNRVRKVDTSGIITTFAGTGSKGFAGDEGPATSAKLNVPTGIALDASGNFYIADKSNNRIRVVEGLSYSLPISNITDPQNGATISVQDTSISGTASSGNGISYVEVSTDGGTSWSTANGTTSWSYGWKPKTNGSYKLLSRAHDSVGNVQPDSSVGTVTVNVDIIPPVSTITTPAAGSVLTSFNCTVSGTASDAAGTGVTKVEVSTDGGATWAVATGTTSWSYAWTAPANGPYTILSRATDSAGNVETPGPGVSVTFNVVADTTPPVSSITNPGPGAFFSSSTFTITGTASDGTGSGVAKVEVSTDGGATWALASGTTSWSYLWNTPSSGIYTIKTRATDVAGNVETPGAGLAVTVDKTPPSSTITSPASGAALKGTSATVSGTATDGTGMGVARVEVSTDGGSTWAAATGTTSWSYTWTLPADGNYTIKCRATDKAGNVQTPGAGISVTVDKTAPVSTITAPAAGSVLTSLSTTITGTASDGTGSGVVKVEVSTDSGNTWTTATGTTSWSYAWTAPANGTYTIKTRSTDKAGNVETASAGISVSVNVPAPPPPTGSQVTLAWDPASSANVVGYKVYVGTASGSYTQSVSAGNVTTYGMGNLTSGVVYYFAVTALDSYGNESPYSNEVSRTAP